MNIDVILFWLLLLDSVCVNILAWFGAGWYVHHFRHLSRLFPLAKGWALCYLVLVLWVGSILYRGGSFG